MRDDPRDSRLGQDLTLDEAAEHFRVGRSTVHRWCQSGKLRHYREGRVLRIPVDAIAEFKAARSGLVAAPATPRPTVRRRRSVMPAAA